MTKPRRGGARRSTQRRGPGVGVWLGAGLLALSAAGALALLVLPALNPAPPTAAESGCRTDAPPPAHIVVLFDASEAYAARHKRIAAAAVDAAQARLPRYGRLSIVALDGDNPLEPPWMISLCSPGDGGEVNLVFANPARQRARWEKAFSEPIETAANRAAAHKVEPASPIAEAIRAISADPRFQDAPERELVLVSDLMQRSGNSPEGLDISLYDAARGYDPSRDPPANLNKVRLRLAMIDRPRVAEKQATAWARFWRPWLSAGGADLSAVAEPF
jgi:hypothetical protein